MNFQVWFEGNDEHGDTWIGCATLKAKSEGDAREKAGAKRYKLAISWEAEGTRTVPPGTEMECIRLMHGNNVGNINTVL